ncbi:MAG: class I SAM-dependent DNA methyltransferase [Synergistaceae bacterium]|nr:class I SAM-dependent DNA methyltransferase [Synergistaceae bacterium]
MDNAEIFYRKWDGKGNEISDTATFWLELLHDVLGAENPGELIQFEKRVKLEHKSFIDAYIPSTKAIIEQKSYGIDLGREIHQSDGEILTPYQQAKRYSDNLSYSERARWIVACNFEAFHVYDMEYPGNKPEVIYLKNLAHDYHKLKFLIDVNAPSPRDIREVEVSVKAGELIGKLYDAILERYDNPDDKNSQNALNVFCVRLVFILYAEDSGLFEKGQFTNYLNARQSMAREAIRQLFTVLSQKPEERDRYLDSELKAFPYVNGGLFDGKDIEFPQINGEPLRLILQDMAEGFDWSGISPTIFGAIFESTLHPETRHSGGMHYTSTENIHKVIDPLFLDGLNDELNTLISAPQSPERTKNLRALQKKIASLKFLDPACGSGNFLTESFLSLRRIENRILSELSRQITFTESEAETAIQVSISQFYGIEVNDFAVSVAKAALWIAETQMRNETRSIIKFFGDFLPLKPYNNIAESNALRMDWKTLVPSGGKLYIMGNPPFLGYSVQNDEQKKDIREIFGNGKIDYVSGWYWKASEMVQNKNVKAAFVSTNSITQGEQVSYIFKPLHEKFGIGIDFAHQSFVWDSESLMGKAHVHVVVIGFSTNPPKLRRLYTAEGLKMVNEINFYLMPFQNVFVDPRDKPVSEGVPAMLLGNLPRDGGHLIIEDRDYAGFIKKEPEAEKFIRRYVGAYEFINNVSRWCLWLVGVSPDKIMSMPLVYKRIKAVQSFRQKSKRGATRKLANISWLFAEIRQPKSNYIVVPRVSSEKRSYIPMGFMPPDVIASDAASIIPDATLYDFGVLTSRVHMVWARRVCGRLKSDYRYSSDMVYNTFAWPEPSPKQRAKIEETAKGILNARALYPDSSFAALYDDSLMPPELRRAHQKNDEAVCNAYGWDRNISEDGIAAGLFRLYRELAGK